MAEFRPDVEQDRKIKPWIIILPVAVLGMLVFSLVFFNALYGRPDYEVGLYDTARPVAEVTYGQARWAPQGQPVTLDDDTMVAVGRSEEGFLVYTTRSGLEGGGGGRPETGAPPTDYSQVYLRTREGTYQPIIRR